MRNLQRSWITAAMFIGIIAGIDVGAAAQSSERGAMVREQNGQQQVLYYSPPNIERAVTPDFVRADIEIFDKALGLSDVQRHAILQLIDRYLSQFKQLKDRMHPGREAKDDGPPRPQQQARGDDNADGAGNGDRETEDGDSTNESDMADRIEQVMLEELRKAGFDIASVDDLPVNPNLEVGISMQAPEGGTEPPEPNVDVSLSFGSDNDSLSDEMKERLKKAAEAIVPRITEHVREHAANMVRAQPPINGNEDPMQQKWREIEQARDRIAEFRKAKAQLKREFLQWVQNLLAESQIERWPALIRALTREKTLPDGRLAGESTNLLKLVSDMDLPSDVHAGLAELLHGYEIELHRVLQRRNRLAEDLDRDVDTAFYNGKAAKAVDRIESMLHARRAVQAANEQYMQAVAGELEESHAKQLRQRYLADAYPSVYRTTIAEEAFTSALNLDSLSPSQHEDISELRGAYEAERFVLDDRLRRAVQRKQIADIITPFERMAAMVESPGLLESMRQSEEHEDQVEAVELFRQRQRLDARYMTTLYRVLNPDQVTGLPNIPEQSAGETITVESKDSAPN